MAFPVKTLVLFDVDGTLTKSRQPITPEMAEFLDRLSQKVTVGLVGGSDLSKIAEQMNPDNVSNIPRLIQKYSYVFSENGLVAHKNGQLIGRKSISSEVDEETLQTFINFCLRYLSDIRIPIKRGNFVEFRTGMINVSPIGRSCSLEERLQFSDYDAVHNIRKTMVEALNKEFAHMNFSFSIGGQISIDCFPKGWDKTFCLQFVEKDFDVIHFFGDRTAPGGNDHEIFADPRTIGHTVTSPDQTRQMLEQLFFK